MKRERMVGARLPDHLIKELEVIEAIEHTDRSTTVSKLLASAIHDWKLHYHARQYADGQRTLARAAQDAGVSLWKMHEYVRAQKIPAQYDDSDLAHDLERLARGK